MIVATMTVEMFKRIVPAFAMPPYWIGRSGSNSPDDTIVIAETKEEVLEWLRREKYSDAR